MSDKTIAEIFAERLARLLDVQHGMQKEIADTVGISPSRMNNIIKGRRGTDEDLRRAICKVLKVNYDEFIFGRNTDSHVATSDDPELQKFVDLYRQYGSQAFLRSCIERLEAIKKIIEEE